MTRTAAFLVALALAPACGDDAPARDDTPPEESAKSPASDPVARPVAGPLASLRLPATGDGARARADLDGQIAMRLRRVAGDPGNRMWVESLVDFLHTRAETFGKPADYAQALTLAEAYVAAEPEDPRGYLLRARTRARVHLFDEALADVDRALERKLPPADADGVRASIAQARGDLDRALELRETIAAKRDHATTWGSLGALHGLRGEYDEADAAFTRAAESIRTTNPIGVAWLLFQWARVREAAGERAEARAFYEEAYRRLPQYTEAAAHLALLLEEIGERERAVEILRGAVATSSHPEYKGLLAAIYRRDHRFADADALAGAAKEDWEALLAILPFAYADHAARFYLGEGGDPARALALARTNLEQRTSASAYQLALEAAVAANATATGCELARAALAIEHPTKAMRFDAWRALDACDAPEAAALARELGINE